MMLPVPLVLLVVLVVVEGSEDHNVHGWQQNATLHTCLVHIVMLPLGETLAISRLDLPFGENAREKESEREREREKGTQSGKHTSTLQHKHAYIERQTHRHAYTQTTGSKQFIP